MAIYTVTSDKVFLRCTSIGLVDVYELENLYIAPVKQKYWTLLATLLIGVGEQYEALKIGGFEIKGFRLNEVMQDLLDSRLMVNQGGLCFLPMEGVVKVEYYRVFDRFNWRKYGVTRRLTMRWVCTDVLEGCPMATHFDTDNEDDGDNGDHGNHMMCKQTISEKGKELEENRKPKELDEAMVHKSEKGESVKEQETIEKLEKQMTDLAVELQLYAFKHTDAKTVDEFYGKLVSSLKIDLPASKVSVVVKGGSRLIRKFPYALTKTIPRLIPLMAVEPVSSVEKLDLELESKIQIDRVGWRVLNAVVFKETAPRNAKCTVVFYDGDHDKTEVYESEISIPNPTEVYKSEISMPIPTCKGIFTKLRLDNLEVYDIVGIGPRLLQIRECKTVEQRKAN